MELRDLQLFKLNILRDVANICEKNYLDYFLFWGTLLGAVRHKGFIPWDDDIDIVLFWDDYRKLIEILKRDYKDKYFVQNIWNEPYYPALYTQLRVIGTTSMPLKLKDMRIHWGICIDIFPMVSASSDNRLFRKQLKAFQYASALIAKEQMRVTGEHAFGAQKVMNCFPLSVRNPIARRLVEKYAFFSEKEPFVCGLDGSPFSRQFRASDFYPAREWLFEGDTFLVPNQYDAILKESYGDYMTPPPEDQRGGHELTQGETIVDPDHDYKEYLNNACGNQRFKL